MPLHMRLPKRGFNNIFAKDYAEVNLGPIQKAIDAGKLDAKGTIDHDALKAAGLARGGKDGVRLLGKGELHRQARASSVAGVSKGAREAVEKAGGSVELIEVVPAAEKAAAKKNSVKERPTRGRQATPRRSRAQSPPVERLTSREPVTYMRRREAIRSPPLAIRFRGRTSIWHHAADTSRPTSAWRISPRRPSSRSASGSRSAR